ncbi:MAG: efflux RND transporter periplasmic adaptor subunit [Desulfuromonas sp.]|nr:MAG: efflux RND transporter periplasmic adaptor subunit [Desulfuromonas sp.]
MNKILRSCSLFFFVQGVVFLALLAGGCETSDQSQVPSRENKKKPVPVEVATIEHGPLELRRTFSGTLEARAEFVVAPKVAGRVESLVANISDSVKRGEVVAELDSDEYVQEVAQARANLAVSQANLVEARNALEISRRELARITTLRERGVASESQLDAVKAGELARQAELEVAKAQVVRAESILESAKIRLGYTRVTAGWSGGDDLRIVAERFVDEGETVGANAPLLRIVELNPITGVVYVTERDYAKLQGDQEVSLTTDAFAGETFVGKIERIAPVFKQATRQARVELVIDNPQQRLKPGMFIRATVVLASVADAVVVPERALTKRGDGVGIFLVSADGNNVRWQEVQVGIRDGERVQLLGEGLEGRVVTLGQQMLEDGSQIVISTETRLGTGADAGGR